MKKIDLTNQRFGRLVVLEQAPNNKEVVIWSCLCDCGGIVVVRSHNLRRGHTRSCGCLRKEFPNAQTHGHCTGGKVPPEHRCWSGIKTRCFNKNDSDYETGEVVVLPCAPDGRIALNLSLKTWGRDRKACQSTVSTMMATMSQGIADGLPHGCKDTINEG